MADRVIGRFAALVYAASLALAAAGVVLLILTLDTPQPADAWGPRGFSELLAVGAATVGFIVLRQQPRNTIGWCFHAAGLLSAIQAVGDEWAMFTLSSGRDLPGGAWGAWLVNWLWVAVVAILLCYVVLLFPDGHFATKASRRFGVIAAPLLAIAVSCQMFASYELQGYRVDNPAAFLPIGQETAESMLSLMIIAIVGAQVLFIRRLRRATGTEREQMRWFVVGEACAGFGIATSGLLLLDPPAWLGDVIELFGAVGMLALLVCAAVAILRYRLYDVDLVISRSVVFLGLTGFVTLAYAAIVGGVGALVQRTDEPNHVLAIGAAVVVALAFQPVRSRLHRFADRVAYGTRAEPYEVLADLAEQLRHNQDADLVLARLAQSLTEGTGAAGTIVWLRVLGELRPAARYPDAGEQPDAVPVDAGLAALPGDRLEPVEHDGELLGAITLTKRYTDPLPAAADRLVGDLAAHAGLLLRNLRLTAELQRHVDELRESRQRLVTAQDAERRRIERDLHDGAQQQLVALKVHLGLAGHVAAEEQATRTAEVLTQMSNDLTEAIATLRELAHGIYPPRLAADGLCSALQGHASRLPFDCEVSGDIGRYGPDVESATYFCCLEALQNVGKYAGASHVRIALAETDGRLTFTVVDDGQGFDLTSASAGAGLANMRDRVEVLGGGLTVTSTPGRGTTVTGWVPVRSVDAPEEATFPVHV